jgi:hypothetical protein
MKRRLFALLAGIALAMSMVAAASAGPIVCPDDQTATHSGGTWYCAASPNGNPTGAGWHKGTGDHL